jgi:hypothetical protein
MARKCEHGRVLRMCSMCAGDLRPLFESYHYKAIKKGRAFHLTFEEFSEVIQRECYYCKTQSRPRGLDRDCNEAGYSYLNVKAACKPCNFLKKDLGRFEFLQTVRQIQRAQDQCSPEFQRMNELLEDRDKRIAELEAELAAVKKVA